MTSQPELARQIQRLASIVRNAHMKRALSHFEPHHQLNFWRLIDGGLLDLAVLEWCKVFGTDAEATHWKRFVKDADDFRCAMLDSLGLDESQWGEYWEWMKNYRDEFVAHQSDDPSATKYPDLTIALESTYFLYSELIGQLRKHGDTRFPNDLMEYSKRFAEHAKRVAQSALEATAEFREEVN